MRGSRTEGVGGLDDAALFLANLHALELTFECREHLARAVFVFDGAGLFGRLDDLAADNLELTLDAHELTFVNVHGLRIDHFMRRRAGLLRRTPCAQSACDQVQPQDCVWPGHSRSTKSLSMTWPLSSVALMCDGPVFERVMSASKDDSPAPRATRCCRT